MGHLGSINGCGVRSCDSHWEKRTNVSRDFCLSVRAEEVSLPKDLAKPVYQKAFIVSDGHRDIKDMSFEAVSDLNTLPYLILSETVLSLLFFSTLVIFRSASFNNRL